MTELKVQNFFSNDESNLLIAVFGFARILFGGGKLRISRLYSNILSVKKQKMKH